MRGGFERLFAGDAVQPALVRKFFVVRKIKAHQQADAFRAFLCGCRSGLCCRSALELQLHLVAQAESLLPAFEFVTRLLCNLFIPAKIENQIGLRHA